LASLIEFATPHNDSSMPSAKGGRPFPWFGFKCLETSPKESPIDVGHTLPQLLLFYLYLHALVYIEGL